VVLLYSVLVLNSKNPHRNHSTVEETGGMYSSHRKSQHSLNIFGFWRLKSLKTCIRIHEVAKSEIVLSGKVPITFEVKPSFIEYFKVRHFKNPEDKELGPFALEIPKSQNATHLWRRKRPRISTFQHFGFQRVEESETRQ
jgi:hypothetical protein